MCIYACVCICVINYLLIFSHKLNHHMSSVTSTEIYGKCAVGITGNHEGHMIDDGASPNTKMDTGTMDSPFWQWKITILLFYLHV